MSWIRSVITLVITITKIVDNGLDGLITATET